MIGLQFVAIIFALWMLYFSYLHYRRHEFNRIEFITWELLWVGLIFVVILPQSVKFFIQAFSITRTFDFVVIVGIMVLFGLTFRMYVLQNRIEKKIQQIVRDSTLKNP